MVAQPVNVDSGIFLIKTDLDGDVETHRSFGQSFAHDDPSAHNGEVKVNASLKSFLPDEHREVATFFVPSDEEPQIFKSLAKNSPASIFDRTVGLARGNFEFHRHSLIHHIHIIPSIGK
jgi:hypothetical protein